MVLFLELLVLKVGKTEKALSSQPDLGTINNSSCEYSHLCARYWSGSRSRSQGLGIPLAQWGAEWDHIGPNLSGYRGAIEPASRSLGISLASASARRSLEKEKRLMDPGRRKAPPLLSQNVSSPYSGSAFFSLQLETSEGPFWSTRRTVGGLASPCRLCGCICNSDEQRKILLVAVSPYLRMSSGNLQQKGRGRGSWLTAPDVGGGRHFRPGRRSP